MTAAIGLRDDYDAGALRAAAKVGFCVNRIGKARSFVLGLREQYQLRISKVTDTRTFGSLEISQVPTTRKILAHQSRQRADRVETNEITNIAAIYDLQRWHDPTYAAPHKDERIGPALLHHDISQTAVIEV